MTTLTTDYFKLDLSHLNISFLEENTFFEKGIIKQQSLPFDMEKERGFIDYFNFIEDHNSNGVNEIVTGVLFHNDKYYDAEIMVVSITNKIKSIIYYNADKLTIFNLPLKSLPWGSLNTGGDIYAFAEAAKVLDYPQTKVNFVQVYAPEKHKDNDFASYEGFINNSVDGLFEKALSFPFSTLFSVKKMNEMRPFLYKKEIVKFIFEQAGYTIEGDFETNDSINKALQYHNNSVFYTTKDFSIKEELVFTLEASTVSEHNYPSSLVFNKYSKTYAINKPGVFQVDVDISGDIQTTNEECYLEITFGSTSLTSALASKSGSGSFSRKLSTEFYIDEDQIGQSISVQIFTTYNTSLTLVGEIEINGTAAPLYQENIELSDLLPDTTVGQYIIDIEKTWNLHTIFNVPTKVVRLDFYENSLSQNPTIDLSNYALDAPSRTSNKKTGYKISFQDQETLFIDKKGTFLTAAIGFEDFKIPIEPLSRVIINAEHHVQHQEGVSMLFYEANTNAKPLFLSGGVTYTRVGFVHHFQRQYLYQQLNAEKYTLAVSVPNFLSLKIGSESKLWMYNNYYAVFRLKRKNTSPYFEKLHLELLKLKSLPNFVFGIEDQEFLPPTAFTTTSILTSLITQFYATISHPPFGASYFTVDISADLSTDPQGQALSFGWEVISSPGGNAYGSFLYQNTSHSKVRFTSSGYFNLVGDYVVRLTVVNTSGLSDTIDVTVTVS